MVQGAQKNLIIRPPVVVVLGHVDHGKTSLLNAIRELQFTGEKPGGAITQHIGAYQIEKNGKKITFIDTPGHEAFTAIRSRGAKAADVAILVVAADEGVRPQTKEAIEIIKKAGLPVVVAINKIDKPGVQLEKVKGELAKLDISVESMGGKVPAVLVSAKTGQGIEEILEVILLIAEMEKLSADITKTAEGVIIEAYLDSRRGSVATLLLRDGTLKVGEIIGTHSVFGKIKTLEDFQSREIQQGLPSMPLIILGFENVPQVGEEIKVFSNEEEARQYVAKKEIKEKKADVLFIGPDKKVLNLILKADVLGSLEAIEGVIKNLPQDKVILRVLKAEAGDIDESDVQLAKSSRAVIFGFRVKKNNLAVILGERMKIKIFTFDIIYDLIQGIRNFAEKLLSPEILKTETGRVKILAIFKQEKNRQIIGGKVIDGEVKNHLKVEVEKDKIKVGEGRILQLQKNKMDVDKALKGQECGVLFEGDVKIEEEDVLIGYEEEKKKTEL